MVPTQSTLFKLLSARMTWLSQREVVLGQNIANADTPGFRPRDLRERDFARLVDRAGRPDARLAVQVTDSAHLAAAPHARIGLASDPQRSVFEASPDGNAVVLEEQTAKLAETALAHQTTSNLYQKYLGMVRTALGTQR
ncbi:MAG: flagellar basal body rod protein FlgB [Geminicoccaceae bacterium]|nr:flagellar basal body rod protein FlgB [Geminicoccaceae bacterium]